MQNETVCKSIAVPLAGINHHSFGAALQTENFGPRFNITFFPWRIESVVEVQTIAVSVNFHGGRISGRISKNAMFKKPRKNQFT
jgi:hypothetical protein